MNIGLLKEVKNNESRVGATPSDVAKYISHGHTFYVEKGAGIASGFSDEEYENAGAILLDFPKNIFDKSEMIIKVKEPLESEYQLFRPGQILFTYLHLASNPKLTNFLIEKKITSIAYETITDSSGNLPCLRPMSEIAGRLSIQIGSRYLETINGGKGLLLASLTDVNKPCVLILGCGVAGQYALDSAYGLGCRVIIIDINQSKLDYVYEKYNRKIEIKISNEKNIIEALKEADLIIGAVLIPGGKTPKIIKKRYLSFMKKGSVFVDISIDQGGCSETSKVTSHEDPVYVIDGITHYCVGNMPGIVSMTSTIALTKITTPYGLLIADLGVEKAIETSKHIRNGLNTYKGTCLLSSIIK